VLACPEASSTLVAPSHTDNPGMNSDGRLLLGFSWRVLTMLIWPPGAEMVPLTTISSYASSRTVCPGSTASTAPVPSSTDPPRAALVPTLASARSSRLTPCRWISLAFAGSWIYSGGSHSCSASRGSPPVGTVSLVSP
jgi:hypothetical protein